jgi:hypothetical protein
MTRRRSVAVLLAVLVLAACGGDDDGRDVRADGDDTTTPASAGPVLGDHWHLAFEASVCGDPLPPPMDAMQDETGIHTHGDGLIHVHPFTTAASGDGAVLGLFFDTIGATVDEDGVTIGGTTIPFEGECAGAPAHLVVTTSTDDDTSSTVVTSPAEVTDVLLAPDGGAVAVGLTTADDLPRPASVDALQAPADVTSATTMPPATGEGTSAADVAFGFAPVLGVASPPPCRETATPARHDAGCYELGPVGGDGRAIESAEATYDNDVEWTVHLTLTPEGIDGFNAIAGACYQRAATCPTGQLAVVVDGAVTSAPTIQAERFERDQIQINGAFTEAEAKELATSLSPS